MEITLIPINSTAAEEEGHSTEGANDLVKLRVLCTRSRRMAREWIVNEIEPWVDGGSCWPEDEEDRVEFKWCLFACALQPELLMAIIRDRVHNPENLIITNEEKMNSFHPLLNFGHGEVINWFNCVLL